MSMLLQQYLHPKTEEGASDDVETVEVEETEDKPKGKKAVKDDGNAGEEGTSANS